MKESSGPSPEGSTPSDEPKEYKKGPVVKGEWNVCVGVLGRPGSGKSQFAVSYALGLAQKPGCYIIAHDLGWRLPETLHNGRATGVKRHESVEEARQALASDPRGIHCVPSEDAGEVIALAEGAASASLEAHGGQSGFPAIVLIDEVVAAGMCDPNRLAPPMRQLITLRRHKNVGVIWTCQSARMVHNQLLSLATELYLFNLTDKRDFDRLEEVGINPEVLAKVRALPKYKYERVVWA